MRFAALFAIASAQQFSMDEVADMIAMEELANEESELTQTEMRGGKWDPTLARYNTVQDSPITSIKWCKAAEGWLQSQTITWANGQTQTSGNGGVGCQTIKMLPNDCITSVDVYADGYVAEWTFQTKLGSYGHVGHFMKKSSFTHFDFGGACLKGLSGRTNGMIVEQSWIY